MSKLNLEKLDTALSRINLIEKNLDPTKATYKAFYSKARKQIPGAPALARARAAYATKSELKTKQPPAVSPQAASTESKISLEKVDAALENSGIRINESITDCTEYLSAVWSILDKEPLKESEREVILFNLLETVVDVLSGQSYSLIEAVTPEEFLAEVGLVVTEDKELDEDVRAFLSEFIGPLVARLAPLAAKYGPELIKQGGTALAHMAAGKLQRRLNKPRPVQTELIGKFLGNVADKVKSTLLPNSSTDTLARSNRYVDRQLAQKAIFARLKTSLKKPPAVSRLKQLDKERDLDKNTTASFDGV